MIRLNFHAHFVYTSIPLGQWLLLQLSWIQRFVDLLLGHLQTHLYFTMCWICRLDVNLRLAWLLSSHYLNRWAMSLCLLCNFLESTCVQKIHDENKGVVNWISSVQTHIPSFLPCWMLCYSNVRSNEDRRGATAWEYIVPGLEQASGSSIQCPLKALNSKNVPNRWPAHSFPICVWTEDTQWTTVAVKCNFFLKASSV